MLEADCRWLLSSYLRASITRSVRYLVHAHKHGGSSSLEALEHASGSEETIAVCMLWRRDVVRLFGPQAASPA